MRDVVVKPARSVLIQEIPVVFVCKCGFEIDMHPTKTCPQFKGFKIKTKT